MDSKALLALAERVEGAAAGDREIARLPERIVRRIEIDAGTGCWNWTSPNSLVGRGRGYVSINGKPMLHHRAIWTLLRGRIPESAWLCHHCDNPRCGNPSHVYLGNAKTNAADMGRRGRTWAHRNPEKARETGLRIGHANTWARGQRNPKAKLTPDQVEEIRNANGSSYAVAASFGVNATTIQRIRRGEAWNF